MSGLQGVTGVNRINNTAAAPFVSQDTTQQINAKWEEAKDLFRYFGFLNKNGDVAGHAISKELMAQRIWEEVANQRGVPQDKRHPFNYEGDSKLILYNPVFFGKSDTTPLIAKFGSIFDTPARQKTLGDYINYIISVFDKPDNDDKEAAGKTDGLVTWEEFGEAMATYGGERYQKLFQSLGFRQRVIKTAPPFFL